MPISPPRKVALIHDWLVTYRGGEKVLEAIAELYPEAELYTLFHTPGRAGADIESHPIHVSPLNRLPGVRRYYRYLLPFLPTAIEQFALDEFDLVISSSHCVAKGVIPGPRALHVCYSHTPMRYAWDKTEDYFPGKVQSTLAAPVLRYLREWDRRTSHRVDHFIANSKWIAGRIQRNYGRDSTVIYPFVDLATFELPPRPPEDFYLVVSSFAPYKRIDLAIEACKKLGRKLKIIGSGQHDRNLRALADSNTEFLGHADRKTLANTYGLAKALIFPGEEDFGIVPLEAMACGRPVIAFGRGGAMETVLDGETGLFFPEQTIDSLVETISRFEKTETQFRPEKSRERALYFTKERFQQQFRDCLDRFWEAHAHRIAAIPAAT